LPAWLTSSHALHRTLSQITHTLARVAQLDELAATGAFPNFDAELVAPILEEANKLARDVLAPLNPIGHKTGAKLGDNGVIAAPGFAKTPIASSLTAAG
jgi:hypothetical protein